MPGRLEVPLLILLIFVVLFAGHARHAQAAPVMQAAAENVVLLLHDEACAIPAVGGGQYHRAQWIESGKPVEGCWTVVPITPQLRVVLFYFLDRTIAAVPAGMFVRVSSS